MNNIQTCAIKEPHSHLVHGQTFECEKGVFMNQPIQENKERCQNCGMRIEDFRETGQFYCDEEGKQRHDFPPQNTSREEIPEWEERFEKIWFSYPIEDKTYLYNLNQTTKAFILAEIEASEKRGCKKATAFYKAQKTGKLGRDDMKKAYSAGQKAERERMRKVIEEYHPQSVERVYGFTNKMRREILSFLHLTENNQHETN